MKHRLGWFTGLIALAFILIAAQQVHGYTDPANCTSATLSDTRVNPGQSVTWIPGMILDGVGAPIGFGNSSLSFNGSTQYVSVNWDASLDLDTAITVEQWIYPHTVTPASTMRAIQRSGLWGTYITTTGALVFYVDTTDDGGSFKTIQKTLPAANQWYHVIGTYDGSFMRLYVNTVAATPVAQTKLIDTAVSTLYIGNSATTQYFDGCIDEIRVYNRSLSSSEAAQHYQGLYINEAGLVLHLDFDGEALDQSVEGNDGTLNGGPAYTDGWASVPVSTYFNSTLSTSTRLLVNSSTGQPLSLMDTAPAGVGVYTATLAPDNSIGNGTITGFIVDQYLVSLGVLFHEVEASFSGALYATGESVVDGHSLTAGDTVTIDGVHLSWNTYTSRFEGTVTKSTPQTVTYGAAVTGSEATYGITNFAMNNTEVVTWTTGTFDVLKPFLITGDLLGAFAAIPAQLLGASVAWTLFMIGFSGAIYSYYGAERTLVVWLIGWGLFSGIVRGEATMFGLFLLCLGGGLIMARMWMGSRSG